MEAAEKHQYRIHKLVEWRTLDPIKHMSDPGDFGYHVSKSFSMHLSFRVFVKSRYMRTYRSAQGTGERSARRRNFHEPATGTGIRSRAVTSVPKS
jgi:hypothetical protein